MAIDLAGVEIAVLSIVTGAVIGYLVNLWQTRLHPWVMLLKFTDIYKSSDIVSISKELAEATSNVYPVPSLSAGDEILGNVKEVYETVRDFIAAYKEESKQSFKLEAQLLKIESAKNEIELIKELRNLMRWNSIRVTLFVALTSQDIIPPAFDPTLPNILPIHFDPKTRDGCFEVTFKNIAVIFGQGLNGIPVKKERTEAFLNLLSRLEKEKLLTVFHELEPILKDQLECIEFILKETSGMVDEYSRWRGELSITNFGSTPFVIFPEEAQLCVDPSQEDKSEAFVLPCRVLARKGESDWEDKDIILVRPDQTETYSIITKDIQKEISGGKTLRGVYNTGKTESFVTLKVRGRELPWKREVRSTKLLFKEKK